MDPIQAAITEIWALYAVGTCLIASRLFARIKLVGFRGLQPDDVLAIFAWYAAYEFGSKMFLVGETLYLGTVWTLKLCMAFFYRRLVRGLWSEKLILPLLAGIGATGLAGILTIYLTCTPVSKHWQILPYPGGICVPQNPWTFITIMGLNLATDLCILSLPIPVLAKMRTNVLRKIGLVFLFGLGLFTMVAAVVRIVSIFVLNQESAGALWSIREDFIAVVVTQAPMVYPLFGRKFWETAYGSGHGTSDDSVKHNPNNKSGGATGESHELTFGSATMNRVKRPKDPYSLTQLGITQEEMILSPTNGSSGGGAVKANGTTVSIEATNSNSDNEKPGLTRTLSLKSRKGRASEKEKPHSNNTVMVEHCVTTTTSHCPEEQKRRDIENWRKQPWET
ncbi:hypothetical protein PG987_015779 [Apiospora arundinis]